MFNDILEAAACIIERDGLGAVSTNAVAETAGVSIGSLYQYFPNQIAILAELTRRERELLRGGISGVALKREDASLDHAVEGMIEAAVVHQLARPRLARELDFAEASLDLILETELMGDDIISSVAAMLRRHAYPRADEAAQDLVSMAKGMIDAAGLAGETDAAALSARVRRAALGYLRY